MTGILLALNEATQAHSLASILHRVGYEVLIATDGEHALALARRETPDLLLLDRLLPLLDGLSVCHILHRESDIAMILLMERDAESDRILGLDMGADDTLAQPFTIGELLARIRAVLRRVERHRLYRSQLSSGDLRLDIPGWRAWLGGRELQLTASEFTLLVELVRNAGAVLSPAMLTERLARWGPAADPYAVCAHIRRLRHKIESDPTHPQRIITVRGLGYRWEG